MRAPTSGLTTRQFERETANLSAEFVIAAAHRANVCFSPTSPAIDQDTVGGRVVDVSSGGIGLLLDGFLPRMCDGVVRIFDPDSAECGVDGEPRHEVIFEHAVKVRRVTMNDRRPSYNIGLAFRDPEPDIEDRVQRLLDVIAEHRGRLNGDASDAAGDIDPEACDA